MAQNKQLIQSLEGGVDRKILKTILKRFMAINQGRLQRARAAFTNRQQLFFDLIPLCFMENHPLLPGFVSYSTPAGISHYEPDKATLAEVSRLTRSYRYRRQPNRSQLIYSLFLMGSCGSLAHTGRSDLDIWVCHAPGLSDQQRQELQQKCTRLEHWAKPLNLEVHFFLMDDEQFRHHRHQPELSGENCGSSQHSLLLDEFYRTALLMAGRYPIWWLIPPGDESHYNHYALRLREQRYIGSEDTVDFGAVTKIPAGEFLGAGLWQMFKGLESPYKSILKLLLTEFYASPAGELISRELKHRIYQDISSLDALDPYILLYEKLEKYLLDKDQNQRLELVRKALYFKVGKRLSHQPRRRRSWQRGVMEKLTRQWQWTPEYLKDLDQHHQWKADRVAQERAALVAQLMHSYRFLNNYSRSQNTDTLISQRDMQLLGRRLYAAFERRANKVEFINPGISRDMSEANLSIRYRSNSEPEWQLLRGALKYRELDNHAPLKRAPSLIRLLSWCHVNQILDNSSHLSLFPGHSDLREHELQQLINALRTCLPVTAIPVTDDAYLQSSHPQKTLLFINVGVDPMSGSSKRNLHLLSNRTDALGFSASRANHVLTIDQVTINSWNEWSVSRFEGSDALIHYLREYLNLNTRHANIKAELHIRCYCHNRARQIQARVQALFDNIDNSFLHPLSEPNCRYILQIEHHYHVLQHQPQATVRSLINEQELIHFLGQPQQNYSPVVVDPQALQESVLSLILPTGEEGLIQVFYRVTPVSGQRQPETLVYLLDEKGSLLRQRLSAGPPADVLPGFYQFLQNVAFRLNAQPDHLHSILTADNIDFYEIEARSEYSPRYLKFVTPPQTNGDNQGMDIQVIIEPDAEGDERITLFCDNREFTQYEHGEQLLATVANYIIEQQQDSYSITDIDLPPLRSGGNLQTLHYVQRKQQIEQLLDNALPSHHTQSST